MRIITPTLFLCFFSCVFSYAQQAKTIEGRRKVLAENIQPSIAQSSTPAEESAYFGYENKIAEISSTNQIPQGFPTRSGFTNKEEYRKAINVWIKQNPNAIKSKYQNTEITD